MKSFERNGFELGIVNDARLELCKGNLVSGAKRFHLMIYTQTDQHLISEQIATSAFWVLDGVIICNTLKNFEIAPLGIFRDMTISFSG